MHVSHPLSLCRLLNDVQVVDSRTKESTYIILKGAVSILVFLSWCTSGTRYWRTHWSIPDPCHGELNLGLIYLDPSLFHGVVLTPEYFVLEEALHDLWHFYPPIKDKLVVLMGARVDDFVVRSLFGSCH